MSKGHDHVAIYLSSLDTFFDVVTSTFTELFPNVSAVYCGVLWSHCKYKYYLNLGHCHAGAGNCVFPTLWRQFGLGPHMGGMVKSPQPFDHIVYIFPVTPITPKLLHSQMTKRMDCKIDT